MEQLTLDLYLQPDARFDNFVEGQNTVLISLLKEFSMQTTIYPWLYLWGQEGVGRTHCLQAVCHAAHEQKLRVAYFPMKLLSHYPVAILQDMEKVDVCCFDDIDAIAGVVAWEEALFHFYNRALSEQTSLIMTANTPPAKFPGILPDLKSRLSAMVVFQLHELSDEDKLTALQQQALQRGLKLSTDVGRYLLLHCSRSWKDLLILLTRLDRASLAAQRRLTIPFVKKVLSMKNDENTILS